MQNKGYVQQLALSSLKNWLESEIEGKGSIKRIERPSLLCKNNIHPLAIMSVWETLIEAQNNKEYCSFIEGNGFDVDDVRGFIEGWEKFECGRKIEEIKDLKGDVVGEKILKGCEIWLPSVWNQEYRKPSLSKLNPYLSFYQTKSSVSRTMRRIESLDLETVYDVTLTFPSEVSTLGLNNPDEIKERCIKVIKKFYAWLAKMLNGKIAVNANLHSWKSSNPLNSHYHVHSLLLGEYLENGERKKILPVWFMKFNERTKRYEEGSFTSMLKTKWASFVNKEFNTSYEKLDVRVEFLELRNVRGEESLEGHRKLLHKLKYNRRRPLADLALFYLDNKFDVKQNNILWSSHLVEYRNRPLTLGYWNRMSKVPNAKPVENKKKEVRCPLCSRPLIYVGFEKGRELPSKVHKVFIDRNNRTYLLSDGDG